MKRYKVSEVFRNPSAPIYGEEEFLSLAEAQAWAVKGGARGQILISDKESGYGSMGHIFQGEFVEEFAVKLKTP